VTNNSLAANQRPHISLIDRRLEMSPSPRLSCLSSQFMLKLAGHPSPSGQTKPYHRHPLSGHAHRAELFLSLLQLPFERIDVDMAKGAHKAPDFLANNPFGR
jgi:hypothetical protein